MCAWCRATQRGYMACELMLCALPCAIKFWRQRTSRYLPMAPLPVDAHHLTRFFTHLCICMYAPCFCCDVGTHKNAALRSHKSQKEFVQKSSCIINFADWRGATDCQKISFSMFLLYQSFKECVRGLVAWWWWFLIYASIVRLARLKKLKLDLLPFFPTWGRKKLDIVDCFSSRDLWKST